MTRSLNSHRPDPKPGTDYVPLAVEFVFTTLSQQFPGKDHLVWRLYRSNPQAREAFENFAECEIVLERLAKSTQPEVNRLRQYRCMSLELTAEISALFDQQG